MKKFFLSLLTAMLVAPQAQAQSYDIGYIDGLAFAAETEIPGPNGQPMSLCYVTKKFVLSDYVFATHVQSYALDSNGCAGPTYDSIFTTDQIVAAQAMQLVDPRIPVVAKTSKEQLVRNYAVLGAITLFLLLVALSKTMSLAGFGINSPKRIRAAQKVLGTMAFAAKSDGHVAPQEIHLMATTAFRLTGREFKNADVMRAIDRPDPRLVAKDYAKFRKGLRLREKEAMLRGAFFIVMSDGRMQPAEYQFVTELSQGLGISNDDFRRMLDETLEDLDRQEATKT